MDVLSDLGDFRMIVFCTDTGMAITSFQLDEQSSLEHVTWVVMHLKQVRHSVKIQLHTDRVEELRPKWVDVRFSCDSINSKLVIAVGCHHTVQDIAGVSRRWER